MADVWERDGKPQTSFEVVATAVGHDLSHGTTVLTRPSAPAEPTSPSVSTPVAAPEVDDAGVAEQPARAA